MHAMHTELKTNCPAKNIEGFTLPLIYLSGNLIIWSILSFQRMLRYLNLLRCNINTGGSLHTDSCLVASRWVWHDEQYLHVHTDTLLLHAYTCRHSVIACMYTQTLCYCMHKHADIQTIITNQNIAIANYRKTMNFVEDINIVKERQNCPSVFSLIKGIFCTKVYFAQGSTRIYLYLYIFTELYISSIISHQASSSVSSSGWVNSSRQCWREGSPSPGVTISADDRSITWSCQ